MDLNITLTAGQQAAFNKFKLFTTSVRDSVFILTGYAGTGKTTLMRFFIDYLTRNNITYRLLASTGRAAKSCATLRALEPVRCIPCYISSRT